MTHELIDEVLEPITIASRFAEEWDFAALNEGLKRLSPDFKPLEFTEDEMLDLNPDNLKEKVYGIFEEMYQAKEAEIGADKMREIERMILIRVVDNKWMDHIDAMDQLKSGIGLRALGQQDPAGLTQRTGQRCSSACISDGQSARDIRFASWTIRKKRREALTVPQLWWKVRMPTAI